MPSGRVVITGMGWITPLGFEVDAVWDRLLRGDCVTGPVTRFDARTFATNFASEVSGFELKNFLPERPHQRTAGLSSRFALAAASQAWRQAGLERARASGALDSERMGIYLGAGEGSPDFDNFAHSNLASLNRETKAFSGGAWGESARQRMTAIKELEQEPNLALAHLSEEFEVYGPAFNCMTACAASTQAIGEAFEIIRAGDADVMFAGGTHTMIHPLGMTGFIRLTAMSTKRDDPKKASRPFDATRGGFVMGEGSGMLVIEDLEHALRRGATPLAEIAGFGSSADAFRITDIQPEGKGATHCMVEACRQAGIDPKALGADGRPGVHYISAHGTGTQENDKIETRAVKTAFGELAPRIPFSSVKSMLGHLIQAAGAVELITCVQAIKTGWIPPTINLETPDPECDLDYVPNAARDLRPFGGVDVCLSNSFGFGGQNDTLCVKRYRT